MIVIRQYFNGYYFKCSTGKETISFIPALHYGNNGRSASLQIITDKNAFSIPRSEISLNDKRFHIKIGDNFFSKKGISLNVNTSDYHINGKLKFGVFQNIKYDIMGPFKYIPFMQCRHKVVSMQHYVTGKLTINNKDYIFQNGTGYIEGDRGYSFPKEYIWTHCHFENGSIMLSVADIPMRGIHFKGIIGIIMIDNKEYRIATYLGAKIHLISNNMVVIKQGKYTLSARLLASNHHKLNAPVNGNMSRIIHESVSCKAWYQFTCSNKVLLEFTSEQASFEYEFKNQKL